MKRDWPVFIGVMVGVVVALAVLNYGGSGSVERLFSLPPHGGLLSDVDGPLREIVIQYIGEARGIATRPYRQFLGALPADVMVHVVVPSEAVFESLAKEVGSVQCKLNPVIVSHPITTWSRDRWLALAPVSGEGRTLLFPPAEEVAAEVWPRRKGDSRIADDLAASLSGTVQTVRGPLLFDGGDFVGDDRTVFVTPRVLERNLGHAVQSREELESLLTRLLGKRAIVLDDAPPHHAGMFMMAAGNGFMLVGDPSLGKKLYEASEAMGRLIADPDFSLSSQARFDAVAERCKVAGYRVVRVPLVPGKDGRTWLTPLNVIVDSRPAQRTVYMPTYEGADALTREAKAVWENLGFRVQPIDCTTTFRHFGSLRCLVNVLSRG
jgi:hypothetical protein